MNGSTFDGLAERIRRAIRDESHHDEFAVDGDIWLCAPYEQPWRLELSFRHSRDKGRVAHVDHRLRDAPLLEGKEWVTVYLGIDKNLNVETDSDGNEKFEYTLRRGLVLRIPAFGDNVLLMPGTTKLKLVAEGGNPILHLRPAGARGKESAYEPWNVCWSKATPGQGLVRRDVHSDALEVQGSGTRPIEAARALLAAVVGLSHESWLDDPVAAARTRARATRRRGEIVRVRSRRGSADRDELYAIVVSDELLNGAHPQWCVLAPLVERRNGDDASIGYVPLLDSSLDSRCGRVSADVFGLCGYTSAQKTTIPLRPRFVLPDINPALWSNVENAMRRGLAAPRGGDGHA